ncbi:MAG TPA: c-type cytochrome [Candidatus Limnocylindrales bacterium]|nr:c-type cytochrome [Candidatus Limnocylindrales bacterium]
MIDLILGVSSIILFIAFIAYFGYLIYHQQKVDPDEKPVYGVELLKQHYAPGATVEQPTPYWVAPIPAAPDPLEISHNLDRKIVAGGVMLFALVGLVGGYFLLQIIPNNGLNLRALGAERQLEASIHRGKNLYANFCYNCHGKMGLGNGEKADAGPLKDQPLPGRPLNTGANKYDALKDDPARLQQREDFIHLRITRGKPNPPPAFSMPAWGQSEGGPFNEEQVQQLINFIMRGTEDDWADILTIRSHLEGADTAVDPGNPPSLPSGAEAAQQYCTTCHSFTAGQNSPIPQAPNLAKYGAEGPLNEENKRNKASGDADWLFHWVSNAPKIKPGVIMPPWLNTEGGSLDEATVRSIVTYLESLK